MDAERLLIERSLAGSTGAFDELMKLYERPVFKIAYSYVKNVEMAMDISQNVFIKVYTRLETFRRDGHFKAWIVQIACRESIDWLRLTKPSRGDIPLKDIGEIGHPAGQDAGLIEEETRRELLSAVGRLNPRQQVAVSMRYFDGASLPDIADTLGCDVALAKNILFRSLQKLRRHLGEAKES